MSSAIFDVSYSSVYAVRKHGVIWAELGGLGNPPAFIESFVRNPVDPGFHQRFREG